MRNDADALKMVEERLPPGFRFHPTDEELVYDYLMNKVVTQQYSDDHHLPPPPILLEVDLNKSEPWELPDLACVGGKEWYFYSQRDRKYATGIRTNRATESGYWKATGKDRPVSRRGRLAGMRKTLVFYHGRAPKGRKTDWVMHEFRLEEHPKLSSSQEDWVLCRVFNKKIQVLIPAARQDMGNGCYDDVGRRSSSSTYHLPPLMDSYITTFDQTYRQNADDDDEQVPCFSIFTPNLPNQTNSISPTYLSSYTKQLQQPNASSKLNSPTFVAPDQLIVPTYLNSPRYDSSSCDENRKVVIDAVLNHLTNMDNGNGNHHYVPRAASMIRDSPSFGEGSSESFLSDVGFPTIWNHY